MRRSFPITLSVIFLGIVNPVSLSAACDDLAGLRLSGLTITSVESVPAGDFSVSGGRGGPRQLSDLPAFCRVSAVLNPVVESAIGMELWLPDISDWNGRYLAVGNGGYAGTISTNAMIEPLRRGYAVSSTDTGHTAPGGEFLRIEAQFVDFAYRAVHEMVGQSKRIIRNLYDRPQEYAFFSGCSTGGRQALTAAQRFPEDFDGIVAGAPANHVTHLHGQQMWMSQVAGLEGNSAISNDKFAAIQNAVIASCDLNDGVADRVLERLTACSFEPENLGCREGNAGACLAPGEIATLTSLYRGPTTSTGDSIFPGSAPGSEAGWGTYTRTPLALAADIYRYTVFKDEDWSVDDFLAERDIPIALEVIGDRINAADPNLQPLIANGGKLLLYHGWADPGITPFGTVNYYGSVLDTLGQGARDSVRLFMVPGMGHCGGGEGPDSFDSLDVIDRWVTTGVAPDRIIASRSRGGTIDRTRPLCAYPGFAVYDGTGSTDVEENFMCSEQ